MQLSDEDLNTFIELYKKHYHVTLSEERARAEFAKLAELLRILYFT